jgi:hypothetical protein
LNKDEKERRKEGSLNTLNKDERLEKDLCNIDEDVEKDLCNK